MALQSGHSSVVEALVFTPDGKRLISGSLDNSVRIWDVRTGYELRTLSGPSQPVYALALSPDGKLLAGGGPDNRLWLGSAERGEWLLFYYLPKGDYVWSVAFSPDGSRLAAVTGDVIRFWDMKQGNRIEGFPAMPGNGTLAFSPNGQWLVSASNTGNVFIYDAATGREVRRLVQPGRINRVCFSPDGKWLAVASGDGIVKLWDFAQGVPIHTLTGHSGSVRALVFTSDGGQLISAGEDTTIRIWDVATGRSVSTIRGHHTGINSLALSPDGKMLASGSGNNLPDFHDPEMVIKLWQLPSGRPVRQLGGQTSIVMRATFSPDSRWLAVGGRDNRVRLWETATGVPVRTLEHGSWVNALVFSPDSAVLLAGTQANGITAWELSSGRALYRFSGNAYHTGDLALNPRGDRLAFLSERQTVLFGSATGEVGVELPIGGTVTALTFSPDGSLLAVAAYHEQQYFIQVWELSNRKVRLTLRGHKNVVFCLAFSPDGRLLASASRDHYATLWDLATGQVVHSFTIPIWAGGMYAVAFAPDGGFLATAGEDLDVRLWDVSSGKQVRSFAGHTAWVWSLSFTRDGKFLISGSLDGSTRIWDTQTGSLLATLVSLGKSDWLVIAPDGLFDGSSAAWRNILWKFGNDVSQFLPVETFFGEFYHPGLLAEILAGKRPKAKTDIANIDRRQPEVKLTVSEQQAAQGPIASRKVSLKLDLAEAPADAAHVGGSGVRDVRLFRNGLLVKVWRGDLALSAGKATLTTDELTIVAGENRFTAYAFSKSNIKSTDVALTLTGADSLKRPGTAWILAIGINRYADPRFQLNFAVADAQDFAQTLQAEQQKLGRYPEVKVVPLTDAEATKANILAALARLSGTETGPRRPGEPHQFADLKPAQPEDAVFIYYAGHGAAPGRESRRFYLIAQEFQPPEAAASALPETLPGTVNDLELGQALEKIDAEETALVIDACQSGKTLESDDPRQGPMNSQGLAQLAYEKGMYILAAAQGDQAAKELSQLGHGLLTYALVEEGLKQGKADFDPKDGEVVLREWLDYSTQRLPQLELEGMQRLASLGRDVPIVNGEELIKEPEKRSLQRPRVFYRREMERQPLIVAKP